MMEFLYSITIIFIVLNLYTIQCQPTCIDLCTSCNSNLIFDSLPYQAKRVNFLECIGCVNDPNRSTNTGDCRCDKGYYFDGSICTKQKVGIIYEENFESSDTLSDNWTKRDSYTVSGAILEHNNVLNSQVMTQTLTSNAGSLFHKHQYSGLEHDEKAWLIFDYSNTSTDCRGHIALGIYGSTSSYYSWRLSVTDPQYILYKRTTGTNWNHIEVQLDKYYHYIPQHIFFEDSGMPEQQATSGCYYDNVIIASTHGPKEYNINPYGILYKSIMVESVDYTGYDGSNNLQQFNFDIATMDALLGRDTWDSEQFAVYLSEDDLVVEVNLYRSANGGSLGDGYGRFVDNGSYTGQKYFYPGQHINFDQNLSQNQADFKKLTGTQNFQGPQRNSAQNLGVCCNDCQDFTTLEAAMRECLSRADCNGVTYSHKIWGGWKAQGLSKGYGYQLRQTGSHPDGRKFEFSYSKRASENYNDIKYINKYCDEIEWNNVEKIFEYNQKNIFIPECKTCLVDSDTNRSSEITFCGCNKGYYDDGSHCQQQKIGVIYEDDFNTGALTDNWQGGNKDSEVISSTLNAGKYGSDQCVEFTAVKDEGDLFFKKTFQTLDFDEEAIVMFDYVSEGTTGLQFGFSYFEKASDITWVHTTSSPNSGGNSLIPRNNAGEWSHFEGKITTIPKYPFRILFQEQVSASSESFLDNFVLSSIHGPSEINSSPYQHLQPAMMILGNDFTDFDGTPGNQQFNFNLADLETILGRPAVNGEKMYVYFERTQITEEVQFFTGGNNGGVFGNAYGKLVNSASYSSSIQFKAGDWIVFSNNLSTTLADFTLESGTCLFNGPLRGQNQNLETCFSNCQDYNTLEEAMEECTKQDLCEGVTYSHKLWGGSASTGFHRGYGYQLRKSGSTPVRDFERRYEYSFSKKPQIPKKTQIGKQIQCSDCNYKCQNCKVDLNTCYGCSDVSRDSGNSCICHDGFFEQGVGACSQCNLILCNTCENNANQCLTCSHLSRNSLNDCKCSPGKYDIGQKECASCNLTICSTCENNANTCLSCSHSSRELSRNCQCENGKFDEGSATCSTCNQTLCSTCETNANNCLTCSHESRDIDNSCKCLPGKFDTGSQQCSSCNLIKCSTCETNADNCLSCSNLTREISDSCNCKPGYYEIGQAECVQCNLTKCGTCETNDDNCLSCSHVSRIQDSTCNCPSGKVDIGQIECADCNYVKCSTCQTSIENCLSCSDLSRDIATNCQCKLGYYDVGLPQCIKCINCPQCSQAGVCTSCSLGYYLDNENNCQKCHEKCLSCSSLDVCESCSYFGLKRSQIIENNCGCEDGFYEQDGNIDCIKCDISSCRKCNSLGQCEQCINSDFFPPNCDKSRNSGLIEIKKGGGNQIEIGTCEAKCQKCVSSRNNCEICSDGQFRIQELPCECQNGYHDNYGTTKDCYKCPNLCKKCLNDLECLECLSDMNLILDKYSKQCRCKDSYKFNYNEQTCQKCYIYKGECLFQCPLHSEVNLELTICEQINYQKSYNSTLIILGGFISILVYIVLLIVFRKSSKRKKTRVVNLQRERDQQQ